MWGTLNLLLILSVLKVYSSQRNSTATIKILKRTFENDLLSCLWTKFIAKPKFNSQAHAKIILSLGQYVCVMQTQIKLLCKSPEKLIFLSSRRFEWRKLMTVPAFKDFEWREKREKKSSKVVLVRSLRKQSQIMKYFDRNFKCVTSWCSCFWWALIWLFHIIYTAWHTT